MRVFESGIIARMQYRLSNPLSEATTAELAGYSPLVQRLLVNRGITNAVDAERFLNPQYTDLASPWMMHDMEKAVTRIIGAIQNNERIAVYADYDADGIPGASLLKQVFDTAGITDVVYYIPHRHDEGYGLNREAVTELADAGVKVLITVDLGITGHTDIEYLHTRGVDTIVTDHHEPLSDDAGGLPSAYAIVNPKVGTTYPDTMICGCATAYQLARALIEKGNAELQWTFAEGWEKWLLDLVGISTISDLVPLVNENRILATYGMKVLQKTRRKGLQALLYANGVPPHALTEDDIAFGITPKLNAASRMAHPMDAFLLLTATTDADARSALQHIEALNKQRKTLVAHSVQTARSILDARELREVIVVGHPEWNIGVLGLIASNIVDHYKKPAFVWGQNETAIKGSVRGDGSVNVVRMMESIASQFVHFGGHEHAGGFTVQFDMIHTLEEQLNDAYQSTKNELTDVECVVDAELSIDEVTPLTYKDIARLAPFGVANPKPTFVFRNVPVAACKQFGKKGEHLDLQFETRRGTTVRAIQYYAHRDTYPALKNDEPQIDLVASIERSVFRGKEEYRLKIVDVLPAGSVA